MTTVSSLSLPTNLRILISGGTGFLGSALVPALKPYASTIDCISRTNPKCISGDLAEWDGKMDPRSLRGKYDLFIHLAGLYNLRASPTELLRQNVGATHNALVVAQKAEIPHFVHASTVAVTIGEQGLGNERDMRRVGMNSRDPLVYPDMLDTSREFPDFYAKTKAHAEHLVKNWSTGSFVSQLNLRFGILVGDTFSGRIERIDGPYHSAEFLTRAKGFFERYRGPVILPGNSRKTIPIVPVDIAAKAAAKLIGISRALDWQGYKSLHVAPGTDRALGTREMYESAVAHLGYQNREIKILENLPKILVKYLGEWIGQIPRQEVEYILSFPRLDVTETELLLGKDWCPEFKSYAPQFWKGYDEYISNR
ncbi:MAG: SDR family oxidoreductase [Cryobacterium sp.]|nr:SDR family oxidoreductase [Oligoflexia bacterium]